MSCALCSCCLLQCEGGLVWDRLLPAHPLFTHGFATDDNDNNGRSKDPSLATRAFVEESGRYDGLTEGPFGAVRCGAVEK